MNEQKLKCKTKFEFINFITGEPFTLTFKYQKDVLYSDELFMFIYVFLN